MVDTSIIILNYNGKKYLRGCLKSILNQEGDFEVIFVDNCSTDDSVPYVQRRYANEISNGRMKLIITDRNYGFAEGNNIGYKVARGKYVVLVNNDVIVPQGWLKEVTSPLRNHKDIYLVGTAYYDKGFKKEWEQKLFKDKISNTINLSGEVISIPRVTYGEDPDHVLPFVEEQIIHHLVLMAVEQREGTEAAVRVLLCASSNMDHGRFQVYYYFPTLQLGEPP
jgi:GT2 family glycosyltransferase